MSLGLTWAVPFEDLFVVHLGITMTTTLWSAACGGLGRTLVLPAFMWMEYQMAEILGEKKKKTKPKQLQLAVAWDFGVGCLLLF